MDDSGSTPRESIELVKSDADSTVTMPVVVCRCGHERDDHGSRTEQRRGEKVYVQPCEHCPCEVFVDRAGPLSQMIDSFARADPPASQEGQDHEQ